MNSINYRNARGPVKASEPWDDQLGLKIGDQPHAFCEMLGAPSRQRKVLLSLRLILF
jgi:hypothetical protein